jgi:hypothetical protein
MSTRNSNSGLSPEECKRAYKAFFGACKRNDAKTFEETLKRYPYLTHKLSGHSRLAIEKAAARGYMDLVKISFNHGSGLPIKNHMPVFPDSKQKAYRAGEPCPGSSHPYHPCTGVCRALGSAAANGRVEIVCYLLEKGANPNHVDQWDYYMITDHTPFLEAVIAGQTECVKILAGAGGEFGYWNSGDFRRCVYLGHLETIKFMWAAFPEASLSVRWDLIAPAVQSGRLDVVEALIEWFPPKDYPRMLRECIEEARSERESEILSYLLALPKDRYTSIFSFLLQFSK